MQNNWQRREGGFTLIELMIVVTVVAILSAISYPTYQKYMQRSYRSDAQQLMMKMHTRQNQLLIEQRAFATTPDVLNVATSGCTCTTASCTSSRYTVSFNPAVNNGATPPSYTICAVPTGAQVGDGTLTLSSTGTKQRLTGTSCTSGTDQGW